MKPYNTQGYNELCSYGLTKVQLDHGWYDYTIG